MNAFSLKTKIPKIAVYISLGYGKLRNMNYRQVEIFAAIMQRHSITDAADLLGLSQPAVSKSLKMLEDELGLTLFTRTTRGLHATDEALELYSEASRLLQGFETLSTLARRLNRLEHARLTVYAMPTLCSTWLPQVAASFSDSYPNIKLDLRSAESPDIQKLASQGDLDVGIAKISSDNPSVTKQRFGDLHGVCVLPKAHPLAEKKVITPEDFHGNMIVSLSQTDGLRRLLDAQMLTSGLEYRSNISVSNSAMACEMVKNGCGIGFVDSETARLTQWESLTFRPFHPSIKIPIYILRNAHRPQNLAMRLFVEHVVELRIKTPL